MKKCIKHAAIILLTGAMLLTGCSSSSNSGAGTTADTKAAEEKAGETSDAESGEAANGKYRIAAIVKSQSEVWASWLARSLTNHAFDYDDIEITLFDAQGDQARTVQYVETAITQKYDLIIIQKVTATDMSEQFEEAANEYHIPVITVNIPNEDSVSYNIPAPNYDLGFAMGQAAAERLPQDAKILIMRGKVADLEQQRYNGLKEALLDTRPDITVLEEKVANYSKDEGMKLMENWLQVYPEFDGLIAMSDSMAVGAVEACKGVADFDFSKVQIYGVDGLADSCLAIKDGFMTATILQDAEVMAKEAIDLAHKILTGEVTERMDIMVPTEVIDASNVDSYIEKHKANGILE